MSWRLQESEGAKFVVTLIARWFIIIVIVTVLWQYWH